MDPQIKASAFNNAAVILQQVGEFERAIDLLKVACELTPDSATVTFSLGLAYQAIGKPAEAESFYRKALELDSENLQAIAAMGLFLGSQNRISESVVWLKKYCDANPLDKEILDTFINTLISTGREDEACTALESAWQRTQDPDIGLRYTRYLFAHGKPEETYLVIEQVRNIKETPQILAELALAQVIQQRPEEAIQTLQKAVKLDENFDRAWRGLAQCYTQLGQTEQALGAAEHALAINPRHYRNWQAKVDVLILSGKYEDALEGIQTGIQLIHSVDVEAQPVLAMLYYQRFRALLNMGKVAESLETLSQGRKLFPKDERFYSVAAQLYQQLDRPEEGLSVLIEAQKAGFSAGGRFIPLHYMLLHQVGRSKEAWELVKGQFKTRKESRVDSLIDMGIQLYSSSHYQAARNVFEQLLSVAKDDIRLQTDLAFVLVGEGDLEKAEAHFEKVISCCTDDEFGVLAHCNLGFTRILQNRLEEAKAEFNTVLKSTDPKQEAILRVAYWWKKQIIPDYAPHPNRFIKLLQAAQVNLIAIALAQGDLASAQAGFETLQASCPEPLLSEVQACILAADGKPTEAKKALKRALASAENLAEQKMINIWLAGLKN